VSPHPVLTAYYRDEAERRRFLTRLFDDTASQYDRITDLMSLGSGAWYRRYALRRAGLTEGMKVLDVAVGTGAFASAAARIVGPSGVIVGVDPSRGMLAQAGKKLGLRLSQGVAESLPFRDEGFDFATMGYALRHVADLRRMFAEQFRVLRRGGTLLIVDFTRPRSRVGLGLGRFYLGVVVSWMARLGGGGTQAQLLVRYCWDTLEHLVPPETVLGTMTSSGFVNVRRIGWFGILSEYIGRKP
jgi:demethylmenaquinone methyltransferase/2-methoxy-6-polyprenyl-1,4-benzoquinol methylase